MRVLPQRVFSRALEEAAAAHRVGVRELIGNSRAHRISHARQEAMWRLRSITDDAGEPLYSLPQIGLRFGMDHTTIWWGVKRHAERSEAAAVRPVMRRRA